MNDSESSACHKCIGTVTGSWIHAQVVSTTCVIIMTISTPILAPKTLNVDPLAGLAAEDRSAEFPQRTKVTAR